MSADQHVPGLVGDPPNSVLSRPDCAVEDDAVQPVSRDVRAAVVGAQRAHPVPQSAVALLLTEPEKVARFIIPVKARTAGPIGDAWESEELLALTAFVAHQSRRLPIAPGDGPELRPFLNLGSELFRRRQGQLNLSCSQCHDDNWGKRLAGAVIPQAHPTGYPVYRLEWQSLGSLQRRLRNCMIGVRAEPYEYGAPEAVALELYLMKRARGMPLETPAVRP